MAEAFSNKLTRAAGIVTTSSSGSIGITTTIITGISTVGVAVSDLVDKLHLSISDNGLKENRLKLAALARLAQRYMDSKEE